MASYSKNGARAWARENMRGCANVVIPTFTADLKRLNERAIRHDVRKVIEYGFSGTLLVSEVIITVDEYTQFVSWARDEAGSVASGGLQIIHHANFSTLAENIEAVQAAEKAGADLVLLGYPGNFYPTKSREIYDYTRAVCDSTGLGVILFPVPHWGFERIHPAGMDPELIRQLVKDLPNIVCIKAEGGMPTLGGFIQCWKRHSDDVLVTVPIEGEMIPMKALLPIQWAGTSNYELYRDRIPKLFAQMEAGAFEEAMEGWWRLHPIRMAHAGLQGTHMPGTKLLHRTYWKYFGWLNGFNGGPLRQPTQKLVDAHMRTIRAALKAGGLEPTPEPDAEFFVGRHPA
jgi:4-hydroxy-tetrahydrodipicolinate synthase